MTLIEKLQESYPAAVNAKISQIFSEDRGWETVSFCFSRYNLDALKQLGVTSINVALDYNDNGLKRHAEPDFRLAELDGCPDGGGSRRWTGDWDVSSFTGGVIHIEKKWGATTETEAIRIAKDWHREDGIDLRGRGRSYKARKVTVLDTEFADKVKELLDGSEWPK